MANIHATCHQQLLKLALTLSHRELALLCQLCTVVAEGLVCRWTPQPGAAPPPPASSKKGRQGEREVAAVRAVGQPHCDVCINPSSSSSSPSVASRMGTAKKAGGKAVADGGQLQVDQEAGPELKEALEVSPAVHIQVCSGITELLLMIV